MQIPQPPWQLITFAQEQLGIWIPVLGSWSIVQDFYEGSYNISQNPREVSNDIQRSFGSISSSNRRTYRARRQCTPWWDQASYLSLGIREGWAYQLSICPLVQSAAAAESDRMMQAGTIMERIFRSMFVVCKWNANESACFQEKFYNGQ